MANENLYLLTNENSEYMYLAKYNLQTGKIKKFMRPTGIFGMLINSYNEKYRVIGINEDAKTTIKLVDMQTGKQLELPQFQG